MVWFSRLTIKPVLPRFPKIGYTMRIANPRTGRFMRLVYAVLPLAIAATGCDATRPPATSPSSKSPVGAQQSATTRSAGAPTQHSVISGRVVWVGPVPNVPPITTLRSHPDAPYTQLTRPAPNAPAVAPDGAIAGAVVFLRGIDPANYLTPGESPGAKWPPVTVEMHDERPMIRQGDGPPGNIGFVRRGDEITIVSRQSLYHSLSARGAAYWTVTLPDADRPRTRRFDQSGVVELSSGAYYFWMRGYIWVCEHPYYTATDAAGRWSLASVPPGEYDLVAWLPDWRTERQEHDPDTGLIVRYQFRSPLEVTRRVVVGKGAAMAIGDIQINP